VEEDEGEGEAREMEARNVSEEERYGVCEDESIREANENATRT
jgi:hypothetical protein